MSVLYDPANWWIWALAMGLALFFPVRQMVWVLMVRRAEAKAPDAVDEAERRRLRRRASVTAALLVYVFSLVYANELFRG